LSEKPEPAIIIDEAHEDFAQHIESGSGRIRMLSVLTLIVSVLLLASYFSQLLLPFVTGQTTVTVNLVDPSLLVFEGLIIILTFAWLYVGAVNYLFSTRLGRQVKQARAKEEEIEKRITGPR
jgi:flagellar biosynthesis protein FliP